MKIARALVGAAAVSAVVLATANTVVADGYYRQGSTAGCCFSWSGFYIGAHAGGAWGDSDVHSVITTNGPPPAHAPALIDAVNSINKTSLDPSGGIFGVQAGYNVQSGHLVLGGVVDFSSMRLRDSRDVTRTFDLGGFFPVTVSIHDQIATDWLVTARGRLGWAMGKSLLYVTGGLAVSELRYAEAYRATSIGTSTETASVSKTKAGWTVGAGYEFALDRRWTINGEYLFARFNDVATPQMRVVDSASGPLNTVYDHKADLDIHVLRLGINYKFGRDCCAPLK
jgi:outer membrane immunogenic protein